MVDTAYTLVPVDALRRSGRAIARAIGSSPYRTTRAELAQLRAQTEADALDFQRPTVRADCLDGGINAARPCPWVACRHHLAIHVNDGGTVHATVPGASADTVLDGLAATCALDVADQGPHSLEQIAQFLHVSKERARQIEERATVHARAVVAADEHLEVALILVPRCDGCGRELFNRKARRFGVAAHWCSRVCRARAYKRRRAARGQDETQP